MKHLRKRTYIIAMILVVLFGVSFWASAVSEVSQTPFTRFLGSLFSLAVLFLGGYTYYRFNYASRENKTTDSDNREEIVDMNDPDNKTDILEQVDSDHEPTYSTQEIPIIEASNIAETEVLPETKTPERSRVMSGNDLRRSLRNVKRVLVWMAAIWLFATFVAIFEYTSDTSPTGLYVVIGIGIAIVLTAGDPPLRFLLRKRHKDVSDGSADEDILYRECPHFTLILGVTIIQIVLWLAVLIASILEHIYSSALPLWVNLYVQWAVTIVNIYLIGRRYVVWKGTVHTWTRSHYTVVRHRDVFFGLTKASSKSYVAGTLVRTDTTQGVLEQPPLFERRGTATIRTQDESESDIIVPYVYDPVRFQKAGNIATS